MVGRAILPAAAFEAAQLSTLIEYLFSADGRRILNAILSAHRATIRQFVAPAYPAGSITADIDPIDRGSRQSGP